MRDQTFHGYWLLTGNVSILSKRLKAQNVYNLEGICLGSSGVKAFYAVDPSIGSLLYQTGYLTIKAISEYWRAFSLGLPNREIKIGLLSELLNLYRDGNIQDTTMLTLAISSALQKKDLPELMNLLNKLIAPICCEHWKQRAEFLFKATTVLTFQLVSIYKNSEVHCTDKPPEVHIIVKTDLYIYGIQLVLDQSAKEALQQVKDKAYLAPYQGDSRKKINMGIAFSTKDQQVVEYLTQAQ